MWLGWLKAVPLKRLLFWLGCWVKKLTGFWLNKLVAVLFSDMLENEKIFFYWEFLVNKLLDCKLEIDWENKFGFYVPPDRMFKAVGWPKRLSLDYWIFYGVNKFLAISTLGAAMLVNNEGTFVGAKFGREKAYILELSRLSCDKLFFIVFLIFSCKILLVGFSSALDSLIRFYFLNKFPEVEVVIIDWNRFLAIICSYFFSDPIWLLIDWETVFCISLFLLLFLFYYLK